MAWKYIMFKAGIFKIPVIFPDKLVHQMVADAAMPMLKKTFPRSVISVVSAGTIEHVTADDPGGDSETLGIASDLEDENTINEYSYWHGV